MNIDKFVRTDIAILLLVTIGVTLFLFPEIAIFVQLIMSHQIGEWPIWLEIISMVGGIGVFYFSCVFVFIPLLARLFQFFFYALSCFEKCKICYERGVDETGRIRRGNEQFYPFYVLTNFEERKCRKHGHLWWEEVDTQAFTD